MHIPFGYLSLEDAKAELGYSSLKSIYNLIHKNLLTKYKIGRVSVVPLQQVNGLKEPIPATN